MPAKLKVYRAQMGFFESVVAAPSQKAALGAWGVRQDLFGEGLAGVTDDAEAVKAALAAPGQPLRRPAGGKGGFEDAASAPTRLPEPPKTSKPKVKAPRQPAAPPRPPPDRGPLDDAERALRDIDAAYRAETEEIDRARRALEARAEDASRDHDRAQRAAAKALEKARRDYERALARR